MKSKHVYTLPFIPDVHGEHNISCPRYTTLFIVRSGSLYSYLFLVRWTQQLPLVPKSVLPSPSLPSVLVIDIYGYCCLDYPIPLECPRNGTTSQKNVDRKYFLSRSQSQSIDGKSESISEQTALARWNQQTMSIHQTTIISQLNNASSVPNRQRHQLSDGTLSFRPIRLMWLCSTAQICYRESNYRIITKFDSVSGGWRCVYPLFDTCCLIKTR